MALAETEQLSRMMISAALSRAICTIGELGVADHIQAGSPQTVENLARLTGSHERSLYRLLRFTASYGVFRETDNRAFDHTPLSAVLRTDAEGTFRPAAQMFHRIFSGWDVAFPGGMERTADEYQGLFERSGFRLSCVIATKSAVCMVEATPA